MENSFIYSGYTYTIVDEVPLGFQIWNIGTEHAPSGYLPLCRVIPGTNNIEVETLKAIRCPDAHLVMNAVRGGCNTILKMEKFLQRYKGAAESTWEYRQIQRIKTALPILKTLKWDGREVL